MVEKQQTGKKEEKEGFVKLAWEITRTALKISDAQPGVGNPSAAGWALTYHETADDIFLVCAAGEPVAFSFTTPLVRTSFYFVDCVAAIIRSEDAAQRLGLTEQDLDQVIFGHTVKLLSDYIRQVPLMAYHQSHVALKEVLTGYVNQTINPMLKRAALSNGQSITQIPTKTENLYGIKRNFRSANLLLLELLDRVDRDFSKYRKTMVSSPRVLVTGEQEAQLPEEYQTLREQFGAARRDLRLLATPTSSCDAASWLSIKRKFLDENYPCLADFAEKIDKEKITPGELAYEYLSRKYGNYSPEYMKKRIGKIRKALRSAPTVD